MSYVDDPDFNPYSAPKVGAGATAYLTHGDFGRRVEYAGFWIRFGALLIDAILLGVVSLVMMIAIFVAVTAVNIDPVIAILICGFVLSVAQFVYFPLMHSSEKQATYGKAAMGIKVTDLHGRRISFLRALGRELAKGLSNLIFYIGFLMAAFTERKQSLHDMIAGTVVIRSH